MTELARLTWRDAEVALTCARLAVVPVGSLEQHGPHLTLDTDLAVADAFAQRLDTDLGEDALLCPSIAYGLSEHHMAFPGTVTLRLDTFVRLLLDVIESLAHWGLRRVVVVNGHGGNIDALRLVSAQARRDHGCLVAAVMWAQLAADEIAGKVDSPSYGHACEVETSVVMALAPDRVYRERISAPVGRRSFDPFTDPPHALVDLATPMQTWTDDGALGDPTKASDDLGGAVVEIAYRRALDFARRFAGQPLPGDEDRPA